MRYRVSEKGINVDGFGRIESGSLVPSTLPAKVIDYLLSEGLIGEVGGSTTKAQSHKGKAVKPKKAKKPKPK